MRTLLVLALVLALVPSIALADARYKRPSREAPPVTFSDRTKPIAPKVEQAAPISSDAALAGLEKAEPTRREQEDILVKIVANTPDDDPDKADLLFRLAEHYARQMRFWRLESAKREIAAKHLP